MDSHIIRKAAWRLPALAGIAVLRFNTRGTTSPRGTSQGNFSAARDEKYDVEAAVDFARKRFLPKQWLLGWSFGTDLALLYGNKPSVEGAILVSPPLLRADDHDLDAWADSGKPVVAMVPQWDDYLRPDQARDRFARIPQAGVIAVEGARHLLVGEAYVRRVLDETVARMLPGHPPLPTSYDGQMTFADTP
jgi:alpha/beta superfamily hydrolase